MMEHRVLVPLPISYIRGLVSWVKDRISEVEDEVRLQQLHRQEKDLELAIVQYETYKRV